MNTDLIKELAQTRRLVDELKQKRDALLEKVTKSTEYTDIENALEEAGEHMVEIDVAIRKEALATYDLTQNKKPGHGIEIKIFSVATILDRDRAREWCMGNFTPALKLDESIFKRAAIDGTIPASLVTVSEEPRAQIASDLSEFLPDPNICPTSGKPNAECQCEKHRIPF